MASSRGLAAPSCLALTLPNRWRSGGPTSAFRWPGGSPGPIFLQVAGGIPQRATPRGIETVPQNLIRLIPA